MLSPEKMKERRDAAPELLHAAENKPDLVYILRSTKTAEFHMIFFSKLSALRSAQEPGGVVH